MDIKSLNTPTSFLYLLLFICIYYVFFQHLDSFHIRNWDESMFAVNAYEMGLNNNFSTPYYKNLPDLWNSKPPLQIWFQVIFIKLIGFNELAIRLPSAIASSLSAIILFLFTKKRSSIIFALCVFFVFITSIGVSTFHTGRTGDSDALLSLFMLCSCLSFYKWIFENNPTSLLYFFIFLTLAFLTKSIASLLYAPALLFSIIYFKKINALLTNKWFYIGLFIFLSSSISFFMMREQNNPGYINYVISNDLGRINKVIESHQEPFDFYINNLFFYRFTFFILFIPSLIIYWKNKLDKSIPVFIISLFLSYFIIISISSTKLEWYDLPLFPIISFICAYFIYFVFIKIYSEKYDHKALIIIVVFFSLPLYYSFRNSYKSEIPPDEKKLELLTEYAFRNKNNNNLNNTSFITNDYDRSLYFYKYKLNTQGQNFNIITSCQNLNPNDEIIVESSSIKKQIDTLYNYSVIDSLQSVLKIKILSLKK